MVTTFILKDIDTDSTVKISYSNSELSKLFNSKSIENDLINLNDLKTESDPLLLILDSKNDYTISFINSLNFNIAPFHYSLNYGEKFFEFFKVFWDLDFKNIFDNLEEYHEKKFEFTIYLEDNLLHFFNIQIIKESERIIFLLTQTTTFTQFTQFFPNTVDYSSEALAIIQDNHFVYVNELFSDIVHKNINKLYTLDLYEGMKLVGADNKELVRELINIKNKTSFFHKQEVETNLYGHIHKFKVFLSPISFNNKSAVQISAMDCTEHNLLKEISFSAKNELHLIRTFAKMATFIQDNNKSGIIWSPGFLNIIGELPSSKSLNEDLIKYILNEDLAGFQKKWVESIKYKRDFIYNFRIKSLEGIKYLYLYSKIKYSDNGKIENIKGYIQDITETKFYQEKLEKNLIERNNIINQSNELMNNFFDLSLKLIDLEFEYNYDYKNIVFRIRNTLNTMHFIQKNIYLHYKKNMAINSFMDAKKFLVLFLKELTKYIDISKIIINLNFDEIYLNSENIQSLTLILNEIIQSSLDYVNKSEENITLNIVLIKKEKKIVLNITQLVNSSYVVSSNDFEIKILEYITSQVNSKFKVKFNEKKIVYKISFPIIN